jgi:hypothetical protein
MILLDTNVVVELRNGLNSLPTRNVRHFQDPDLAVVNPCRD